MEELSRRELLCGGLGTALAANSVSDVKTLSGNDDVEIVIIKSDENLSDHARLAIRSAWMRACEGTSLEGVKVILLDRLDVEVVRK